MRSLPTLITIVALVGCTNENVGSVSAAETAVTIDCEVEAYGVFSSGDSFSGEASDIANVESIDWEHITDLGDAFVTAAADPDWITCRRNGDTTADFRGTGTASVNGESGYSYFIDILDNRPAPTVVCTCEEDDDRGHGNDADCTDDDNPGNSSGCNRGGNGHGNAFGHDNIGNCSCDTIPAPGDPDEYSITIARPDGTLFYSFSGSVIDGDIAITEI